MKAQFRGPFEFNFEANGIGLAGNIQAPFSQIPVLATVALPSTGGVVSARSDTFQFDGLISVGSISTSGTGTLRTGLGWETRVQVVIEGCNVSEVVTADQIVLLLSSLQPTDGRPRIFSFAGSRVENLRIAGRKVKVSFDPRMKNQFSPENLVARNYADRVSGSHVPLARVDVESAEARSEGNVVSIPGFGSLTVGELLVTGEKCQLTMLHLKVEVPYDGELVLAQAMVGGSLSSSSRSLFVPSESRVSAPHADRPYRAKPSPDDIRLAKSLAESVMSFGMQQANYREMEVSRIELSSAERDIYLADVIENSADFLRTARVLERHNLGFPCLVPSKSEPPIPMSIGLDNDLFMNPEFRNQVHRAYEHVAGLMENSLRRVGSVAFLEQYPLSSVQTAFRENLERFLAVRFSARQSNISGRPGYEFTVETNTPGLTVVYSASNYLRVRAFQAPTPRVSQWIQPGEWIFGVATSSPVPQWDPSMLRYDIPPSDYAKLSL
jgi:hypothetical protein